MYKTGQVLGSPFDFDNAMFFGLSVSVWQNDQIIDYGGKIQQHTEDSVVINGGRYLKSVSEFKIR